MKKQTLFNLASMPKLVLTVTLVVMLGILFGATSYLLKTPKTDLPIISPIIEAQCEINSECELVYTGSNICLPCDTSIKEYRCLSLEEAKKIEEERFKRMVDNKIFCERCLEKPQHTCICENGKCEKVKKELVEEVIIRTDKTEYEQGEMVEVIIKNDLDRELIFRLFIESFNNSVWNRIVKDIRCDCNFQNCPIPHLQIKVNSERIKFWNQKKELCDVLPLGQKLRIEMVCGEGSNYTIYSNEFTIKEKSALDARCEEKVKFDSPCHMSKIIKGYEFDLISKECKEIIVYGGCDFKSPFETLEECQEVCEEKSDTSDWQTYRNEEFGFEVKYPANFILRERINEDHESFVVGFIENIHAQAETVGIYRYNSKEETEKFSNLPYVKLYKRNDYYLAIWGTLNELSDQILSSFKFIEK